MPTAPTPLEQQLNRIEQRLTVLETSPRLSASVVNDIRKLDTVFQIGAPGLTLVIYAVRLLVESALLSPQEVTIRLLSDANNPPTTEIDQGHMFAEQVLGLVSVGEQIQPGQKLVGVIQPNHYVMLGTSGDGTPSLVNSLELVLHG